MTSGCDDCDNIGADGDATELLDFAIKVVSMDGAGSPHMSDFLPFLETSA